MKSVLIIWQVTTIKNDAGTFSVCMGLHRKVNYNSQGQRRVPELIALISHFTDYNPLEVTMLIAIFYLILNVTYQIYLQYFGGTYSLNLTEELRLFFLKPLVFTFRFRCSCESTKHLNLFTCIKSWTNLKINMLYCPHLNGNHRVQTKDVGDP